MTRRWLSLTTSVFAAVGVLCLCHVWAEGQAVLAASRITPSEPVPMSKRSDVQLVERHEALGPQPSRHLRHGAQSWAIDCVDCPPKLLSALGNNVVATSIAVDSIGHTHIAFHVDPDDDGTGDVYYGFHNGADWHFEAVRRDVPVYEPSVSLALDESDNPHIGFASHYDEGVLYAHRDPDDGSWKVESVDQLGFYPSLALDGDGNPHMSYQNQATTLTYAFRDGEGWHTLPLVEFGYFAASFTSIDLDSSGHPHIACNGNLTGGYDLWYAAHDGTSWYTTTADTDIGWHARLSLDVGQDDTVHIAYRHWDEQDLRHATLDASAWQTETVASAGSMGFYPSLRVDDSGYPHIVHYDNTENDLEYAYQDAAGWHTQTVDSEGNVGQYGSLALDAQSYARAVYYDEDIDDLKVAHQDASGWHIQPVALGPEGYVGLYTALALDDDGYAHVSYYDWAGGDLRHAWQDATGWYTSVVDTAGDVGQYTSLALAGDGYPRISYYDVLSGDLKYAYQDASGWHSQTVDTAGDVGQYTSLALESTFPYTPHISYYDATTERPKYALLSAAGWLSQTVGTGFPGGTYTSLALDGEGYPHISYYEHYNGDLIYTRQIAGGAWIDAVVAYYGESWNRVGMDSALALDDLGNPYISYYDGFLGALRVATGYAPVGWSTMWTVDSGSFWHTSLVMHGAYAHVSYYDAINGTLKHAYQDADGWQTQTVDSDGDVGQFSSLALDADDYPHISYYDAGRSDLRVAYITDQPVADFTVNPVSGVSPLTVTFTDTSTGGAVDAWLWSFGDGVTSSVQSPTHTYAAPGTYTVTLTVTGPGGSDAISRPNLITAFSAVQAAFEATPRSGPVPLDVTFTNASSGDYTSSLWGFGDGLTSTTESPSHTYTAPGPYTVTLSVDGPGGTDTLTRAHLITGYLPVNAAFDAAPTVGFAPLTVIFTNTSSGDFDASEWAFGDGLTSGRQSPTHTYEALGTHTVTLTVAGPGGTDTATQANCVTVYEAVSAGFTADPVHGISPLTVAFTDTSIGPVTSWQWDFGDGGLSMIHHPTHTYTATGIYSVALRVGAGGPLALLPGGTDTVTHTRYVTVTEPPPEVDFEGYPQSGDAPLTVHFTSTVTGTVTDYHWQFGDGGASQIANPAHNYETAGTFGVTLVVTGPGGTAERSKPDYILVNAAPGAPTASFTADLVSGTAPLTVTFTAVTTGPVESWLWGFGDGEEATTGPVVSHTYVTSGTFDVGLTVTNSVGSFVVSKPGYVTVTSAEEESHAIYLPLVLRLSH